MGSAAKLTLGLSALGEDWDAKVEAIDTQVAAHLCGDRFCWGLTRDGHVALFVAGGRVHVQIPPDEFDELTSTLLLQRVMAAGRA